MSEEIESGKWESEWNATALDFKRFDEILRFISEHAIALRQRDNSAIEPYYSAIREGYLLILALLVDSKKTEWENDFKSVKEKIDAWVLLPRSSEKKNIFQADIAEALEKMHEKLMTDRQLVGMGVKAWKRPTVTTKLRNALLPHQASGLE